MGQGEGEKTERRREGRKAEIKGGGEDKEEGEAERKRTDQKVEIGQSLITLLSMKMENTIAADEAGIVDEILVAEGSSIAKGTLLLKIKPLV